MRTHRLPKKASISIEDVARESGVSPATVSRVINKFPSVKEENRRRVLAAIKKLKFQPSLLAQRLAKGKTDTVSLIVPRYEGIFYSFYALELIRGIGLVCESLKLDLLLHITDTKTDLNLKDVGGIVFADIIGNQAQLEDALAAGIACIVINHRVDNLEVSSVSIDNAKGAEDAVNYLISLGHKRIAHITGDLVTQSAQQRLEGYKRGLKKYNLPIREGYVIQTDYSRGQARDAAYKLLGLSKPPTALFVASDSMALEVMAVVTEMKKQVPRDLSIIGFDDNPSGLYVPVALTTIKQPLFKMAECGVLQLNRIMKSKARHVRKTVLPCKLVVRESCASCRES